ncbi:stage III sporulation protein AF [Clostridium carnis]
MEKINTFIITLVTMLILMTAIELIAPDNSMKKYLRFILGLILISVMLTPIVSILTGGEKSIINEIEKYQNNYIDIGKSKENIQLENTSEKAFKNNLDKNCNNLLKEEFKGKDFKSNITCNVDLKNMTYSIDKISVGVKDGKVKKIPKIIINTNDETSEVLSSNDEIEGEEEIKNYIENILKVSKDKIEVHKLE